jgi:putative MFS transporter
LYFSIALYSIANILNGFATSARTTPFSGFIAGVGLAGELGAGITLVAESMPKEKRGYGTMIVATVGLSGALLAWVIDMFFPWRVCFFIGGGSGLLYCCSAHQRQRVGYVPADATEDQRQPGQFSVAFH